MGKVDWKTTGIKSLTYKNDKQGYIDQLLIGYINFTYSQPILLYFALFSDGYIII